MSALGSLQVECGQRNRAQRKLSLDRSCLGRAFTGLALALVIGGCSSGVHTAKILDIPLGVQVTSVRLIRQPKMPQDRPSRVVIGFDVTIFNPSSQVIWANACRGQAFDRSHAPLYSFDFNFPVAGAYISPNGRFTGKSTSLITIPPRSVGETTTATATCQAWDWGDHPPI